MKDRFDDLRWSPQKRGAIPDVDAIKTRSRTIVRSRYQQVGAAAIALGLFVVVGVVLASGPSGPEQRLATDALPTIDTRTPRPGSPDDTEASPQALSDGPRRAETFAGAAATASPGVKNDSSTTSGGAEAAPSSQTASDRAAAEPPPSFAVSLEVTPTGHGAYLSVRVCNITEQSHSLRYNTGQRYDFEVYREGSRVWRWSDNQSFTQATRAESFRPGECNTYNDNWSGQYSNGNAAPPGQYSAVGIITSSPQLRSGAKSFSI